MVDKYVGATNRLLSSLSSSGDFPGQIIALKDGDGRPRSHEKDHFVDRYWTESHELENAVFSDEVSNDSFRQSSGIADFKQADIKSSFSLLIEALPASERSWQ